VRFFAHDLLLDAGQDLRTQGADLRRGRLSDLLPAQSPYLGLSPEVPASECTEEALARLRKQGLEGFLLLHRTQGKRLLWRAPQLTVDAVLLYVETGQAGISSLNLALWEDEGLVPFARVAPEGLRDEELEELDEWVSKHLRERFGPVRSVDPQLVFEVGYDEVEPSTRHRAGLVLRAPRILKWKKGVAPKEAGRLEALRRSRPEPLG
jgi:DNA ligase-1